MARLLAALCVIAIILSSCAGASIAIAKKDLDVQTKTSTAIFIDPVSPAARTLYVEVRSGVAQLDRRAVSKFIRDQFSTNENGYRIVDDPEPARIITLAYVLTLEKASVGAAQAALQQGHVDGGDVAAGVTAGAMLGYGSGGGSSAYTVAAVVGLLAA